MTQTPQRLKDSRTECELPLEGGAKGGVKYEGGSKIRLKNVRESLTQGLISLNDIPEQYLSWVNQDEGLIIRNRKDGRLKAMKCSKRGNDVYQWRLYSRLRDLFTFAKDDLGQLFSSTVTHPQSPCLFITLTYDTKRCSISEAWRNIGVDFNRFISNLKRKYGKIVVFRTWESFANGYPHVHLIMLFKEYKFDVFFHKNESSVRNWNNFFEFREGIDGSWRVQCKDDIAAAWHSFVDVKAIQTVSRGVGYLSKYLTKTYKQSSLAQTQTVSMLWLHNKRAFSLSRDFVGELSTHIRLEGILHNSNKKAVQMTLEGDKKESEWELVGFYPWAEVEKCRSGGDLGRWSYELLNVPGSKGSDKFDCPKNQDRFVNFDCRECGSLLKCRLGYCEIKRPA